MSEGVVSGELAGLTLPLAGSLPARAPGARAAARPVFSPDTAAGADDLGRGEHAAFLAELMAHARAQTPFTLGVFGPAGSGKSFFAEAVARAAEALSAGAGRPGAESPYVPGLVTARVDAAAAAADPAASLASGVFDALAERHPRLAADARHAGTDPVRAARDTHETLNEARRRLDAERQTLDGLRSREARLPEQILSETSGSRVDGYARGNRSRIERALRSFGFLGADPVATYKDVVRDAAEQGGSGLARASLGLGALWSYRGQARLVLWAVALLFLAWGAAALQADQQVWIEAIRGAGDRAAPVADWAQAHVGWLRPIRSAAIALAIVLLLANLVRAVRFLQPVLRGVALLRFDIDEKRRDLNGLLAHQTRRVDALAAEVENAAAQADEAERRAGTRLVAGSADFPSGDRSADGTSGAAERGAAGLFFASLGRALGGPDAPGRILVVLDGLNVVGAPAAAALVRAAGLLGPGFVTLLAADRDQLAAGFGETDPALAAAEINRGVQLAYDLGSVPLEPDNRSAFASRLLDGGAPPRTAPAEAEPPRASALDAPWLPGEAAVVAALAPVAGEGPRAVKRFVNTYRVARADPAMRGAEPPVFTALALALAVAAHGTPDAWSALEAASRGAPAHDPGVLRDALAAARSASGAPVELAQARRALDVARRYLPV